MLKVVTLFVIAICAAALRLPYSSDGVAFAETNTNQGLQSQSNSVWGQMESYMMELQAEDPDNVKVEILKNLKPCTKCDAPKRYGETNDGGYAMCSELMENTAAGYSVGVSGYDGWGEDVSKKFNIPIYQFDCTNSKRPKCDGCDFKFYDFCITAEKTRPGSNNFKTIKELMSLNGHGDRGNTKDLVMQIDVEAYEWDLFADPTTADAMLEFSQVSVEFHDILRQIHKYEKHGLNITLETRLKALQNLNKQFVVAHVHGNNARPTQQVGNYSVPGLLEVLYVRRGLSKESQCETDPTYWKEDARNVLKKTESEPPHLP